MYFLFWLEVLTITITVKILLFPQVNLFLQVNLMTKQKFKVFELLANFFVLYIFALINNNKSIYHNHLSNPRRDHENVILPFLLTQKASLLSLAERVVLHIT